MSLRRDQGKQIDWIDTRLGAGFSNFLFVDKYYGAHTVMRRILSLARKQGFQSILVEEIDANSSSALADEDAALAKRRPDFKSSRVRRLSFLRGLPDQEPAEHDFIGGAVFKSDTFGGLAHPHEHVYEAVLPLPREATENNFIHCGRSYLFHTTVGDFAAQGVLYAQQNDFTFVCAHVALRTALASLLPAGDITYAEINQLAGIDHQTEQVGDGRGLDPAQMEAVLNGLNVAYDKIVHEPSKKLHLPTDYQHYLYGCIESGAPALLGFSLGDPTNPTVLPGEESRHIIPVIGHTFNEDAWVPEAQRHYFGGDLSYYPSESWLSSFVAHDDNFGPYYCLPRNFLRKESFRLILALKRFPTSSSALDAETLAFGYAKKLSEMFEKTGQDWLDRFSVFTRLGSLVIRAQCLTRETYVTYLNSLEDWQGQVLESPIRTRLKDALPDFFWMVELSAPELFTATRHKFGEILVAADCPPLTGPSSLLAARLPGYVLVKEGGKFQWHPTTLAGHTALFTFHV